MKLGRQRSLGLLLLMAASLAAARECQHRPRDCQDDSCLVSWQCGENSQCGARRGCVCLPCYTGDSCDEYVDRYPIMLQEASDVFIKISPDHSGLVYQVNATDDDQTISCTNIARTNLFLECPCGAIEFGPLKLMRPFSSADENPFKMDPVTGDVLIKDSALLEPGETYYLQLQIQPYKPSLASGALVLNLTVEVMQSAPPHAAEGDTSESAFLHHDHPVPLSQPLPAKTLSRSKRDTKGTGSSAADLTLTVVGTDPTTALLPGQSIKYKLTIILPQLTTTAMDLLVEIFVMDAVSGITPFALCNLQITAFGSLITSGTGGALTAASFTPDIKENAFLSGVNDRATIDFGSLKNSAAVNSAGPFTDSTIEITFDVSLVSNPAYTNATAIVTAGAEYDSDNYVWVSQASYTYNMSPGYSYPSSMTLNGPSTAAAYSGATFTIDATITDPMGPFTFEVYTPNKIHNKFTVSNLAIVSVGANLGCAGTPVPEYEYFYSVDKRTYHRGIAKFDFVMTGLVYPDLVAELNDIGNKIQLGFTVFFVDVAPAEIVTVGAGITIGTSTLWTSLINVTMGASITVPNTAGTATFATPYIVGGNGSVAQYGVVTYAVPISITSGQGVKVTCTCTPPANHKITGIMWGKAGANIALRPNLTEGMVWDDTLGVTSWTFYINSTGQVASSVSADTVELEVSVQYLDSTARSAVSLSCGSTVTLTGATAGTGGTTDVSGTANVINVNSTTWYKGDQQALLVTLTFPPGGKAYSNMTIETSGDFDVTAFGAQICKVEILRSGLGVPTLGGRMDLLNNDVTFDKISASSLYNDGGKMLVGAIAGVNRGTAAAAGDNDVVLRMTYFLPKNQTTITSLTYNMSMGIQLDTDLIWTGWSGFTTSAAAPTVAATIISRMIPPDTTTYEVGRPILVKFVMKMPQGSVDKISLVVRTASGGVTVLSLCRIVILAIGSSYPCLDPDPYGKELTNFAQPNTIIHDPVTWGLKATVDFGVLRNVGYQTFYADEIADSDAIVVGVLVKGLAVGTDNVTIDQTSIGGTKSFTTNLAISAPLTPANTLTAANWVPLDGTAVAYAGVMKIIDLVLDVPVGYRQPLIVKISNDNSLNMELCFAAVAAVGKNVPCVIPHLIVPVVAPKGAGEEHILDLLETCYYDVAPGDKNESTISIRVGVQFTKIGSSGTLTAAILENATPHATLGSKTYAVTKSSSDFDPSTINTTTTGFAVQLVDNTTTTVSPGQSWFYGLNVIIPPDTMGKLELGVMAPTDGGRAYATVHSLRWGATHGKNIGCMLDMINYDVNLLQNSSLSQPMIHTSQTDTLVAQLGYITNTGLSYMQNFPTEPTDNILSVEVEIMMADHTNATANTVIPVSIAVKFGDVIYVVTKNLQIIRSAADLMALRTYVNFTEVPSSTIYSRAANPQLKMTFRVSHVMNSSRQELNGAIVRVLLPKPVEFNNLTDIYSSNITANFTNNHYLDFAISNLFFTDYLEMNVTVSIDPFNTMIKGLGLLDAAALVRIVCTTFADAVPKYCGTTAVLPFQIDGTECSDDLGMDSFLDCQFSASTAISAATGPAYSKIAATGWSPAVRSGPGWDHHITIDFLKKTRVTRITFSSSSVKITQFKVQYSYNGATFISPCDTVISVTTDSTLLPPACRFEARFGRLIIVDSAPSDAAFVVKFKWYGCSTETVNDTCSALPTTYTDSPGWRQISHDKTNSVFYFCDYSPTKKRTVCFSSADNGVTWNAMPAYIGSLVGPSGGLFYARDAQGIATVSSTDGVNWLVTDATVAAGLTVTAKNVPGNAKLSFTAVTDGDLTADYTGITKGGNYVVKWESCCA